MLLSAAASCGGEEAQESAPASANPLMRPASFTETAPSLFDARFETTKGQFVVTVHRDWAPLGADRFYNLVAAGYYDGVRFHRVLEGFIAEFGIHGDPYVNVVWRKELIPEDPILESNSRGRVTFSKSGPNARTVQVFVSYRDNSTLDEQGFAPFGEVVRGMEIVDALYAEYGDGPPRGAGVYQAMAIARGNAYLDEEFPELDRIIRATIEPGG